MNHYCEEQTGLSLSEYSSQWREENDGRTTSSLRWHSSDLFLSYVRILSLFARLVRPVSPDSGGRQTNTPALQPDVAVGRFCGVCGEAGFWGKRG